MKRLIIGLLTVSITWAAMARADALTDTRQILAGTVTTKSIQTEYLTGKRDTTAAFKGALAVVKKLYYPVVASSPNPCFVYDPASKSQVPLAGSFCPAKSCPGYPNPVPYQDPCPKVTAWAPAPLQVDGYARLKNGPDLIVRLVATGITSDVDPAHRQHWWATQFQQDASGNYPAGNLYWRAVIFYNFDDGLVGVKPAPAV